MIRFRHLTHLHSDILIIDNSIINIKHVAPIVKRNFVKRLHLSCDTGIGLQSHPLSQTAPPSTGNSGSFPHCLPARQKEGRRFTVFSNRKSDSPIFFSFFTGPLPARPDGPLWHAPGMHSAHHFSESRSILAPIPRISSKKRGKETPTCSTESMKLSPSAPSAAHAVAITMR